MGMKVRTTSAKDVLKRVLREAGWEFDESKDEYGYDVFTTMIDDPTSCLDRMEARVQVELERLSMTGVYRWTVPRDRRADVFELLLLGTDACPDGAFVFDFPNDEIGYRVSLDFTGFPLPDLAIRNAILDVDDASDWLADPLAAAIKGEVTVDGERRPYSLNEVFEKLPEGF